MVRIDWLKQEKIDKRDDNDPYRNFRKPYNNGRQNSDTGSKPPLRNQIKPAQELEIQQIMDNFNCEYDDVVEAVDLYNLDFEECTTI